MNTSSPRCLLSDISCVIIRINVLFRSQIGTKNMVYGVKILMDDKLNLTTSSKQPGFVGITNLIFIPIIITNWTSMFLPQTLQKVINSRLKLRLNNINHKFSTWVELIIYITWLNHVFADICKNECAWIIFYTYINHTSLKKEKNTYINHRTKQTNWSALQFFILFFSLITRSD